MGYQIELESLAWVAATQEIDTARRVREPQQPRTGGFAMTDWTDGGCWFCGKVDKFLIYEKEFDTSE
jgi:hypothetical protein